MTLLVLLEAVTARPNTNMCVSRYAFRSAQVLKNHFLPYPSSPDCRTLWNGRCLDSAVKHKWNRVLTLPFIIFWSWGPYFTSPSFHLNLRHNFLLQRIKYDIYCHPENFIFILLFIYIVFYLSSFATSKVLQHTPPTLQQCCPLPPENTISLCLCTCKLLYLDYFLSQSLGQPQFIL